MAQKIDDELENDDIDNDEENDVLKCNSLRDYTSQQMEENVDENSKFVQVFNEDGSSKTVLKSSLIWLLTESKNKLSQDRLRRVQGVDRSSVPQKRNNSDHINLQAKKKRLQDLFVSKIITIGEWCFFYHKQTAIFNRKTSFDMIVFGSALAFKYNEGKTEKDKQYTRDTVPVSYECTNTTETKPRGVSVSAMWYKIDDELKLEPMDACNFFIDIKNYIATASFPPEIVSVDSKSYRVAGNIVELKKNLLELTNH